MRVKLPKIDFLLQMGILLMVLKVSFDSSLILPYSDVMDTVLAVLAAGSLGLYTIRQSYPPQILTGYLIVGMLAMYCVLKTGNYGFLITVILCMAIRKVPLDSVITHMFVYEAAFCVIHTCYSFLCWFFLKIPFWQNVYGVNRCSFGFVHPNMFSIYVFQLVLMWIWLEFERIKKEHVALLAAFGVFMVSLTRTRTSFLDLLILCFLLLFVNKEQGKANKLLNLCARWITPFAAGVVLFLSVTFASGNPLSEIADRILNTRIRLGGYAYERYGMTLFGQNLSGMEVVWDPFWSINAHTFDNVYTAVAINYGAVWLLFICAAFYMLAKRQDPKINICLIMWALYGVTEIHGLNAFLCFPVLLIVLLYSGNKEMEKKKEEKFDAGGQIIQGNFTDS